MFRLRLVQIRPYSKKAGADFLNDLAKSFKTPKKRQNSSDILKELSIGPLKSSTGKKQSLNSFKHEKPIKTLSHQKPKPKDQDIYKYFDPLTTKYKQSVSDRENEFFTEKLKQVYKINPRFDIMAIGGANGPEKMKLKTFISRLKEDELFDIVDIQQIDDTQFPFVRTMNKQATLKTFGDKRALELTKLFGRTKEKKRESNVKFIKISWEISQSDLENQKTNEIMSQLKKGYKLTIAIDTKDNLSNNRYAFEEDSREIELNQLERLRREKALDYIKQLLEANGSVEFSGKIQGKFIINITPNVNKKEEKKKDSKKNDRATKQKQREQEKRLLAQERAKKFEETIAKL